MAMRDGRCWSGQGTVELAAVMPALLIVAVIAVNACAFFSECASFDRLARQAVRTFATSPGYGQGADQGRAKVASALEAAFDSWNEEVSVVVESAGGQCVRYTATLSYLPTLFGLGLKSEVFGVSLSPLRHSASLVVDPFNPGVIA